MSHLNFGIFNELLVTQNENVALFARNATFWVIFKHCAQVIFVVNHPVENGMVGGAENGHKESHPS